MKNITSAFVACVLSFLVGCASLGLAKPQSFDEQLAQAYGVHTAVLTATTQSLQGGQITSADAHAIDQQAGNARALLDAARQAEQAGDASGASSHLALALTALTALQSYLNNRS